MTTATGPSIDLLRTLAAFADQRDGRRTAAALGVDASAVSRRLKDLAAPELGLLAKRGATFVLTEKGEAALPGVVRLVRSYDQLAGRLTGREATAEVVRVAAGTGLQHTPFARALAAFRAAHPEVGVRVRVCRGRERLLGVARGEFDLALTCHDEDRVRAVCGPAAGLRVETIREQALVVVAGVASADGKVLAAWPAKKPVTPAVLAGLSLLGMDPQSNVRHQLDRALVAAGLPVAARPAVQPGGWASAVECARQGVGTAVVPADMIRVDPALVVRPFLAGFRLADRVVWCEGQPDAPAGAFVAVLGSIFASETAN